jgi:hypothetical protein
MPHALCKNGKKRSEQHFFLADAVKSCRNCEPYSFQHLCAADKYEPSDCILPEEGAAQSNCTEERPVAGKAKLPLYFLFGLRKKFRLGAPSLKCPSAHFNRTAAAVPRPTAFDLE